MIARTLKSVGILAHADNVPIEVNHVAEQVEADLLLVSAHGAAANPMRAFGDTVSGILNYGYQPVLIYQDRPAVYTNEPELRHFVSRSQDKVTNRLISGQPLINRLTVRSICA